MIAMIQEAFVRGISSRAVDGLVTALRRGRPLSEGARDPIAGPIASPTAGPTAGRPGSCFVCARQKKTGGLAPAGSFRCCPPAPRRGRRRDSRPVDQLALSTLNRPHRPVFTNIDGPSRYIQ
jgi:hypothetical protein